MAVDFKHAGQLHLADFNFGHARQRSGKLQQRGARGLFDQPGHRLRSDIGVARRITVASREREAQYEHRPPPAHDRRG